MLKYEIGRLFEIAVLFAGLAVSSATALTLPTLPASPQIPSRTVALVAPADGITDATAAINAAIAGLSNAGGGTLQFGAGTYLVSVNPNATDFVLQLQSNVRLQGAAGGASIIKLADAQPAYNTLLGTGWTVNDVDIEGLTIDLNGINNPVRSEADNQAGGRFAIRVGQGTRIRVIGCTVLNVVDVNTFVFSGSVTDVEVGGNDFPNVGQLPGGFDFDHSTIYTHGLRMSIHDNTFVARSGPGTPVARTAIEIHGDDQTIVHNVINGYANGMNITGQAVSSNRQLYNNNIITNTLDGMEIWSQYYSGQGVYGAQNITITNNQINLNPVAWRATGAISASDPSMGIFLTTSPIQPVPINGLTITGNQITFPTGGAPEWGDSYSGGIILWTYNGQLIPISNLTVAGNTISNAPGPAIWSNIALTGGTSVAANNVINLARSSESTERTGIYISGTVANIQVDDNVVADTAPRPLIKSGTSAVASCQAGCIVGGNTVTPAKLAATVTGAGWQIGEPGLGLEALPGSLQQVSVGPDGSMWGINGSDQIYRYNPANQTFVHVAGALTEIAVGGDGSVWGINAAGSIYSFNAATQKWQQIPGALAQIAVAADGDVWGLNAGGSIYHWLPAAQGWANVPGTLAQIAVGFNGAVWGLDVNGQVYRYNIGTQEFAPVPGTLAQISVGSDGAVWGVDALNNVYRWNPLRQMFETIPGQLTRVSVGSASEVWGVNAQNSVFYYDLSSNAWTGVPGYLAQIVAAANGSVWGLTSADNIDASAQAAPQQAFHATAGVVLAQIASAADGSAWGIDPNGYLYAYNIATQTWISEAPGKAFAQVTVAFGQNVWALDTAQNVYRYNPATEALEPAAGQFLQIAAAANGAVWGVNAVGWIYSFNAAAQTWTQLQGTLSQIAAGFDGAVWGLNGTGAIYRHDPQTIWTRIPGTMAKLSVSAQSVVWTLDPNGIPYRFY